MTRRLKKAQRGNRPYLVCSAATRRGGCQNHPVPYEDVERCLIERRDEIVETCLARDGKEIGQRLAGVEHAISGQTTLENLLHIVQAGGRTAALGHRIRDKEAELEDLRQQEAELMRRKSNVEGPALARRLEELSAALAKLTDDCRPANVILRKLLSRAVVDWRDGGLYLHWKHGGVSRLQYGSATEW
jgi:hypothetical protein